MNRSIKAKIQIVRGLKMQLPLLRIGELGYAYDTNELFIGDPDTGNTLITGDVNSIKASIEAKVEKVPGKSLMDDTEIERLSSITNYDDTSLRQHIADEISLVKKYTDDAVLWDSGTTASRPANPKAGQTFFDSTLGKPIWYNGVDSWVDSTGAKV